MLAALLAGGRAGPAAAAVIDCELDGQPIDVTDGAITAGRSGVLRCVDRDNGWLQREELYRDGKRVGFTTFRAPGVPVTSERLEGSTLTRTVHFPEGEPRLVTVLQDGRRRSENEFARGGQRLRETLWNDRGRTGETQWYMNGLLKRREQRHDFAGAPALAIEDYWDSGQLRQRGSFDEHGRPLGMHQWFRESGTLGSERLYQKGVLVLRRDFDEQGRPALEEEYFEDGSRKASKRR